MNRRQGANRWPICCGIILLLCVCVAAAVAIPAYLWLPGVLEVFLATPEPPPTSGPAVYLIQPSELPAGSWLVQYQEVPHAECTDYAVRFQMPDGLQSYSKVCCPGNPHDPADVSTQWPDTVRVNAPTVGQKSLAFHGPVIGQPSVTIGFIQGPCEGMVQVIGRDDAAADDLAVRLARAVAARVPRDRAPTPSATEQAECYKTIELSISNRDFGPPMTTFSSSDAIYPTAINRMDCGQAKVKLIDPNGKTVMERLYNIPAGTTGYGDYNSAKNLSPGNYKFELWYGSILLKTVQITVH